MKNSNNQHSKVSHGETFSYNTMIDLIQKYGIAISKDSPLYFLINKNTEPDASNELDIKFKNSHWKDALFALSNPIFKQTTFTVYPEVITSTLYCMNQKYSDMMVACELLDNEQIQISFPHEAIDILHDKVHAIGIDDALHSGEESLILSKGGLLALFIALDTIKEVLLVSLLSRQYIADFRFPSNQLDLALESYLKKEYSDNRWLTTLLHFFKPDLFSEKEPYIQQEYFNELLSLGLIIDESDNFWSPSSELMSMASNILTPLPAFYQEAVIISPNKVTIESNSLTLGSINSLCLIDFHKTIETETMISLKWLNKDEYWLEMMGRLTPLKVKIVPEKKLKSDQTFNEELLYHCPSCGAIVKKGQKFCTSCGHKLPENLEPVIKDVAEVKRCPNCGAVLKPGAKFCTECGTKV